MRADEGEIAHAHAFSPVLADQRNGAQHRVVSAGGLGFAQEAHVDRVDDLQMTRQQPAHQLDGPGLQRFRQQRVVGVGRRLARDVPRFFPADAMHVEQQPH